MGIRRYSRDSATERWERRFDELQAECSYYAEGSPLVGDLIDHGIRIALWKCRSIGWKPDGKGECWHKSEPFELAKFGRKLTVWKMRSLFYCSACGRRRPLLELIAE